MFLGEKISRNENDLGKLKQIAERLFANDITGEQFNTLFVLEGDNVSQKSFNEQNFHKVS